MTSDLDFTDIAVRAVIVYPYTSLPMIAWQEVIQPLVEAEDFLNV